MEILIVDDDPLVRLVLQHVLTRAGFTVQSAENGQQALAMLREHLYPIIISDWEMPEMSGVELCRALRAQRLSRYVYFILLTSRDGTQDTIQGLQSGADDFVTKPFDKTELLLRVKVGQRLLSMQARDLTIFALAKLAESRDCETGAHLDRVRNYVRVLAQYLSTLPAYQSQINAGYVELIYLTSPLHDIGKVAIPDSILLKPGKLTVDEFEIMKTHATIGAQTLDAVLRYNPEAEFLSMAMDIAYAHHEKFDGSGYPRGLVGEDIPLAARIVALADVFDALTCKRVYKAAFAHAKVKQIILDGAGKHFDPALVQAFLVLEEQFIRIKETLADSTANFYDQSGSVSTGPTKQYA